jgi:hypothetical protein
VQVPTNASAGAGAAKSGWGDSPTKDAAEDSAKKVPKGRRRGGGADESTAVEAPESPPTRQQVAHMQEEEDGPMAYIPDLDDEEEALTLQVAVAPSHASSRVPTIAELNEEIDMALPATNEIGVDLSVLQAYLMPQEQLEEEDVAWDVEHELQTLASELQREQEERDGTVLPGQASPAKRKPKPAAPAAIS